MLKQIETIAQKIDELQKTAKEKAETLRQHIAEDDAAIAKAKAELEAAAASADMDAYKKAKADKDAAEEMRATHGVMYEAQTSKPLITKAQYTEYEKELQAIIAEYERKAGDKLAKLSDQMDAIAKEASATLTDANALLHHIQKDIFKYGDLTEQQRNYIHVYYKPLDYKINIYNWGNTPSNNYAYEMYKKQKEAAKL